MAKASGGGGGTPRREPNPNGLTTYKVKLRVAEILGQLAVMRGIRQQDVLDVYLPQFEEDLLREMAARQAELTKRRDAETKKR